MLNYFRFLIFLFWGKNFSLNKDGLKITMEKQSFVIPLSDLKELVNNLSQKQSYYYTSQKNEVIFDVVKLTDHIKIRFINMRLFELKDGVLELSLPPKKFQKLVTILSKITKSNPF